MKEHRCTVAIAGLGSRGFHTYAQCEKLFPEKMKIVAIADILPERVERAAKEFQIPFAVSGFGDRELLLAIYGLVRMAKEREAAVKNFYPSVVTPQGNLIAKKKLETYFMPCDAVWRGMGNIPLSGLLLKDAYKRYDAGSASLIEDKKLNHGCRCDKILTGKLMPQECPLFGRSCTPGSPQGACMVSYEGSCYQNYLSDGGNA